MVYDRKTGSLVRAVREYRESERDLAEKERLEIEIDSVGRHLGHEVVLLEADSQDDLRRTHARYFKRLEDLVAAGF